MDALDSDLHSLLHECRSLEVGTARHEAILAFGAELSETESRLRTLRESADRADSQLAQVDQRVNVAFDMYTEAYHLQPEEQTAASLRDRPLDMATTLKMAVSWVDTGARTVGAPGWRAALTESRSSCVETVARTVELTGFGGCRLPATSKGQHVLVR